MKPIIILVALAFCGCASQPKTSVDASLLKARQSAQSTQQDITAIKAGTDQVDYKAGRALQYF